MSKRPPLLVIGVLTLPACGAVSLETLVSVEQHQSAWETRRPAGYEFDYRLETGFPPIFGCPSPAFHIAVRDGAVTSATCLDGGQPAAGVKTTIDTIYAYALRVLKAGNLNRIEYDPVLDYPTLLVWSGPPDAAGSEVISNFQALAVPLQAPAAAR